VSSYQRSTSKKSARGKAEERSNQKERRKQSSIPAGSGETSRTHKITGGRTMADEERTSKRHSKPGKGKKNNKKERRRSGDTKERSKKSGSLIIWVKKRGGRRIEGKTKKGPAWTRIWFPVRGLDEQIQIKRVGSRTAGSDLKGAPGGGLLLIQWDRTYSPGAGGGSIIHLSLLQGV